jgi:hypothetical protein
LNSGRLAEISHSATRNFPRIREFKQVDALIKGA